MKNAKQFILLGSDDAKRKGGDGKSFLAHEIKNMIDLKLPIVIGHIGGSRAINNNFIPKPLLDAAYYTLSVSFQPAIIKYALDNYAANFAQNSKTRTGSHYYEAEHYRKLGL
jgi:hypothetical protein